jgi:hypothetical protein
LQHSCRKKFSNSAIAMYISLSTKPRKQADKTFWSRIWQSWVFSLCSLHPSEVIHLAKFEAYPSGNFTKLIKSQNSLCFVFESTYRQGSQNRWEPVRFDRFPVEPVRPGTRTGPVPTPKPCL